MNKTQVRVITVLERMIRLSREDNGYAEMFVIGLEDMLDDIVTEGGFGTDGQCDPRGDMRETTEWTMSFVQGVDD